MPCWMLLMIASSPARCSRSAFDVCSSSVRCATFCSSPSRPLRVVERDGGLAGEQAQHVAVGLVEAPEEAVHVDVQVALRPPCSMSGATMRERCFTCVAVTGVWTSCAVRAAPARSS